jgi:hypothetical protein
MSQSQLFPEKISKSYDKTFKKWTMKVMGEREKKKGKEGGKSVIMNSIQ